MKLLAILLILFSINAFANRCPQLTGSYRCEVTNNKGAIVDVYQMSIVQTKDVKNTQYHITYTSGEYVEIITDNTPRIKDSKIDDYYNRRRIVASCSREVLMIDEESYLAKDKNFTDIVSLYDGNSSYFSNGVRALTATHDGVLNFKENGEAKKKVVKERDSCRLL